jgi:hypothetical protein
MAIHLNFRQNKVLVKKLLKKKNYQWGLIFQVKSNRKNMQILRSKKVKNKIKRRIMRIIIKWWQKLTKSTNKDKINTEILSNTKSLPLKKKENKKSPKIGRWEKKQKLQTNYHLHIRKMKKSNKRIIKYKIKYRLRKN